MKIRESKTVLLFFSLAFTTLLLSPAISSSQKGADTPQPQKEENADTANEGKEKEKKGEPLTEKITREGVSVEFTARPIPGISTGGDELLHGEYANISFSITDTSSGEPLQGQFPGAWIDLTENWKGQKTAFKDCRERIGLYLQGLVGIRPMIDLNSYFVLVMNRDPSISVIDPIVGITGITKLYAKIILKRPGADWGKTNDDKRLFVSMPEAEKVAVVDTDSFKVIKNMEAGENPVRVRLQPDEKFLWVGNDSRKEKESGVTVIDIHTLKVARFFPTGEGHHEIAFTDDSRYAFVSNREGGSVSIIDVQTLTKVKDIETGPTPISLAYSTLSKSLYVADGKEGTITVIDGKSHEIVSRIDSKPGLGPFRFSQDGRWGVAVNTLEDVAYVIDPSTNRIAHSVTVGKNPYQVAFSRSFAYVRSLNSERVSMIDLSELGKEDAPPVVTFPAGQTEPAKAKDISIADAIVEAPGEAAVLVASPADNTVYYYMEGMNAPMGNFRNYGHRPRAVAVVDRAMRERSPGVYSSTVRIPEAGTYEVAFLLDSPSILHCFTMTAKKNPLIKQTGPPLAIEYLVDKRKVAAGETVRLRFKLIDSETGQARADLEDVHVKYFVSPGRNLKVVPALHTGDGTYEAELTFPSSGAYFVYVACPSLKVKYADLPYMTIQAVFEKGKKQADR